MRACRFHISTASKILFLGSDNFAIQPLLSLYNVFPNLHVVTHHTQPGIKADNKVEQYCRNNDIPCDTPIHKGDKKTRTEQWNNYYDIIQGKGYNLGVICSYGFMIPSKIIRCFEEGMIVVHPSLLPKYRGGAPIFHTIANGDTQSGVSFIEISERKFDAGNILCQTSLPLPQDKDYLEIEEMLSLNAAESLPKVLLKLQQLRPGKPQTSLQVSNAPIISEKHIDLKLPVNRVYNLSRAIKGPRIKFDNKEFILKFKNQFIEAPQRYPPGSVFRHGKKGVFVTCGDMRAVRLDSFKEPSKVFFPATAFLDKYLRKEATVQFQ